MDEAERCHKLAYIAYGRLMAQGTAEEIIAAQGLTTWTIYGGDLAAVAARLQEVPGVEQIAPFGSSLHVTGRDAGALEEALRRTTAGTDSRIEPADTGLEDVFIHLMGRSSDNYGASR
jgi:ABC-2 type transport system ATP-binding protein